MGSWANTKNIQKQTKWVILDVQWYTVCKNMLKSKFTLLYVYTIQVYFLDQTPLPKQVPLYTSEEKFQKVCLLMKNSLIS